MGDFGQFIADWLAALWMVLAESGPFLLVGFVIAGILAVVIPAQWIARRMGGDDVKSVATAAIIGVPVPLCSCSVIPTATQLRRSGASRGATTSFLISTPETGVDSIGATWALMDPLMTVVRPVAAFLTAFAAGVSVNVFGKGDSGPLDTVAPAEGPAQDSAEDEGSCCAHMTAAAPSAEAQEVDDHHAHGHDHDHGPSTEGPLLKRAFRYAFGTLLDDLTPWFLIGFAISGLIVIAVPDGFFAGTGMRGPVAMLAMLIAGVPLYVCATASTPIAAAMMAKGLEPGAALVFLLAGPATNVATMLVVKNLLGKRALVLYLASIAIMSLVIGGLVNRLYPMFGLDPTAMDVDPAMMEHGPISTIAGAILAVLLLRSAWRLRLDRRLGAWLRKVGAPIGLDLTAAPVKLCAAAALVLGYASTAVTSVMPGQSAFVEQFGRVAAARSTPGPLFHAPWPVAKVRRVSTAEVRQLEFGIENLDIDDGKNGALELKAARAEMKRLSEEAEVLTGEGWLLSIEYAVQYRVSDARLWLYGKSEPEEIIRRLAQEAMRQATAHRTADDILVASEDRFRAEVETILASSITEAAIGAELVGVALSSVHAPDRVHSAFRSIASALIEKETIKIDATTRGMERLSDARIRAMKDIQEATSEHDRTVAIAHAVKEGFNALGEVDHDTGGAVKHLMTQGARRRAFLRAQEDERKHIFVLSPSVRVQLMLGGASAEKTAEEMLRAQFGDER